MAINGHRNVRLEEQKKIASNDRLVERHYTRRIQHTKVTHSDTKGDKCTFSTPITGTVTVATLPTEDCACNFCVTELFQTLIKEHCRDGRSAIHCLTFPFHTQLHTPKWSPTATPGTQPRRQMGEDMSAWFFSQFQCIGS